MCPMLYAPAPESRLAMMVQIKDDGIKANISFLICFACPLNTVIARAHTHTQTHIRQWSNEERILAKCLAILKRANTSNSPSSCSHGRNINEKKRKKKRAYWANVCAVNARSSLLRRRRVVGVHLSYIHLAAWKQSLQIAR